LKNDCLRFVDWHQVSARRRGYSKQKFLPQALTPRK
jgi:hypothetical protein